jgi:hypothetical protein
MKYIYHHLGLGDHIICNGLVRCLINPDDKYSMFVKEHNKISVEFMYRDLTNLSFIVGDDSFVKKFISENNIEGKDLIICGFTWLTNCSWDEVFYYQHNIDFKERWKSFNVERDFNMEDYLYDFLNPNNEDFALIHKIGSDGCDRINYDMINPNLKKIYVEKHTENIFDYLKLIELAKEIHCIDSSFLHLVDSVLTTGEVFYHKNHIQRTTIDSVKNKKWKII